MQLKLSSSRIFIYTEVVDFRRSIDGLYALIHSQFDTHLREDIFIFFNRQYDKIKLLAWHGNGFVLLYKRLEQGRFIKRAEKPGLLPLNEKQLSWLLAGLDWKSMSDWNTLEYNDFY
jgi:transposase